MPSQTPDAIGLRNSQCSVLDARQIQEDLRPTLSLVDGAVRWITWAVSKSKKVKAESFRLAIYRLHDTLKQIYDPTGEGESIWHTVKNDLKWLPNGDPEDPAKPNDFYNRTTNPTTCGWTDRKRALEKTRLEDASIAESAHDLYNDLASYEQHDAEMEEWESGQLDRIEKEKARLQQLEGTLEMERRFRLSTEEDYQEANIELEIKSAELNIEMATVSQKMLEVKWRALQRESIEGILRLPSPSAESSICQTIDSTEQNALKRRRLRTGSIASTADGAFEDEQYGHCDEPHEASNSCIDDRETSLTRAEAMDLGGSQKWSDFEIDQCVRYMQDVAVEGIEGVRGRSREVSKRLATVGIHRSANAIQGFSYTHLRQRRPDIWNVWAGNNIVTPARLISKTRASDRRSSEPVGPRKEGSWADSGIRGSEPYWTAEEIIQLTEIMNEIERDGFPDGLDVFDEAEKRLKLKGINQPKIAISLTWARLQEGKLFLPDSKTPSSKNKERVGLPTATLEAEAPPYERYPLSKALPSKKGGLTNLWTAVEQECCAHHVQDVIAEGNLTKNAIFVEASRRLQHSGFTRSKGAVYVQWRKMLRESPALRPKSPISLETIDLGIGCSTERGPEDVASWSTRPSDHGTPWTQFQEDEVVRHVRDLVNQGFRGRDVFKEVSKRLKQNGIDRTFNSIAQRWKNSLREKSGIDERFEQYRTAPLATPSPQRRCKQPRRSTQSQVPVIVDLMDDMTDTSIDDLVPPNNDSDSNAGGDNVSCAEEALEPRLLEPRTEDNSFDEAATFLPKIVCANCGTNQSRYRWRITPMGNCCDTCEAYYKIYGRPRPVYLWRQLKSNSTTQIHDDYASPDTENFKPIPKRTLRTQTNCHSYKWTEDEIRDAIRHMKDVVKDNIPSSAHFEEMSRRLQASGFDRNASAVSQFWYRKLRHICGISRGNQVQTKEDLATSRVENAEPPREDFSATECDGEIDSIEVDQSHTNESCENASEFKDSGCFTREMSVRSMESAVSERVYPLFIAESSESDTESVCSIPASGSIAIGRARTNMTPPKDTF